MEQVTRATQMRGLFQFNKPNCLIIDEIDGVGGNEARVWLPPSLIMTLKIALPFRLLNSGRGQ